MVVLLNIGKAELLEIKYALNTKILELNKRHDAENDAETKEILDKRIKHADKALKIIDRGLNT